MTRIFHADPYRVVGMFLGTAVGDALGWPQEDRSSIVGGNAAREVDPMMRFRSWERNGGSQYQRYRELIRAGEYSDDTQLFLSTARASLRGNDWYAWLTEVELPMWPLYQRGGGAAVLRSARAWSEGKPPWIATTDKTRTRAASYFDAGANGVAMRIAPHAVVTAQDSRTERLLERCLQDGLTTHGHPRALVGAMVYALAVRTALTQSDTLGYGTLLESVLSDRIWQDDSFFLHHVERLDAGWLESHRLHARGDDPGRVWIQTVEEMRNMLTEGLNSLAAGAMAKDEKTLENFGVFSKVKGSGTISAAATLYVAARTAARPHSGLLRTAFLKSADTDTLAAMTTGLLGALHGPAFLGGLERDVQDARYISELAEALSNDYGARDLSQQQELPLGQQTLTQTKRFVDDLFDSPEKPRQLPDGRAFRVTDRQDLPASGQSRVQELTLHTQDGQTLFITHITKPPTRRRTKEAQPSPTKSQATPSSGDDAERPPIGHFAGLQIRVTDMARSSSFYGGTLGLRLTQREQSVLVRGGLVLVPATPDVNTVGVSAILLTLHVPDLDVAEKSLLRARCDGIRRTSTSVEVRDPDGYEIRLITGKGATPAADAS